MREERERETGGKEIEIKRSEEREIKTEKEIKEAQLNFLLSCGREKREVNKDDNVRGGGMGQRRCTREEEREMMT